MLAPYFFLRRLGFHDDYVKGIHQINDQTAQAISDNGYDEALSLYYHKNQSKFMTS